MTEQWQELKETITEMRDNGGTGTQQEVCKFLANYMEILEKQTQQPCEDAVSRHKVLDVIEREVFKWDVIDEVRKLPSVTPKAKTGQWEYVQYDTPNIGNWHCSRCRGLYYSTDKPRWKYCPSCGARMKESEGER